MSDFNADSIRLPDAVLFDFDGTIADSRRSFARSFNRTLRAYDRPELSLAALHKYLGPPTGVTFRELISDDDETVAAAVAHYRDHQQNHGAQGVVVFDGVRELLELLHGQTRLAIATSKQSAMVELLLERLDLRRYFEVVCGSAPDTTSEPKQVTFKRTLDALGSPDRTVMIGDRRFDVEAAAAAGVGTIGVLWGCESDAERLAMRTELEQAGALRITSRPDEIPPLLGL